MRSSPTSSSRYRADDTPSELTVTNRLNPAGVTVRLLVALGLLGALLAGTVYGTDDHFPFGPFRMYSTTKDPDGTVNSTRMEGVTATGDRSVVHGGAIGLRRAEIEGQLRRFRADPALLSEVAAAYRSRNPGADPLVRLEIIVRHYRLEDGKPSGEKTDKVVTTWDSREDRP